MHEVRLGNRRARIGRERHGRSDVGENAIIEDKEMGLQSLDAEDGERRRRHGGEHEVGSRRRQAGPHDNARQRHQDERDEACRLLHRQPSHGVQCDNEPAGVPGEGRHHCGDVERGSGYRQHADDNTHRGRCGADGKCVLGAHLEGIDKLPDTDRITAQVSAGDLFRDAPCGKQKPADKAVAEAHGKTRGNRPERRPIGRVADEDHVDDQDKRQNRQPAPGQNLGQHGQLVRP